MKPRHRERTVPFCGADTGNERPRFPGRSACSPHLLVPPPARLQLRRAGRDRLSSLQLGEAVGASRQKPPQGNEARFATAACLATVPAAGMC